MIRFEHEYRNDKEYQQYFHKMKTLALMIGRKVSFDFLTHFKENVSMGNITRSMQTIFMFSDLYVTFVEKVNEPSIICHFIEEYYLSDRCDSFFNVMLKCPDASARYNIGKLTSDVVSKGFRVVGLCSEDGAKIYDPKVVQLRNKLNDFMTTCLVTLHDKESHKSWSRLLNFYTMLADIAIAGTYQTEYYLKKYDIVVEICDLMLQKKSPKAEHEDEKRYQMGGTTGANAKFGPLVTLVSHLARNMHTEAMAAEDVHTQVTFQDPINPSGPRVKISKKYIISETALSYFTNADLMALIVSNDF